MPVTSTNHGLSIITSRTSKRLALPVPGGNEITNRFNDTGSAPYYQALNPPQSAHKGIDWGCDEGTDVYAMFDGVVEDIRYHQSGLGTHIFIKPEAPLGLDTFTLI